MSESPLGQLAAAVIQVMQAVPYVKPTGWNDYSKYAYASEDDLLCAVKPAMAAAGLCLIPHKCEPVAQRVQGKNQVQVLRMTFKLVHVGGATLDVECMGEGSDTLDKASYKAMTGAYKQALRQAFAIVTGMDAEKSMAAQSHVDAPPLIDDSPDLTRIVIMGKPERWCDLGAEHADWLRQAAAGELTSDNPTAQDLFLDPGWQRHAAARLAQLEGK